MPELNPYQDSTPWGDVVIGGMTVPGVVLSIDGAKKPQEWEVQKPTEKSGGGSVWKGEKPAESIVIVTALVDSVHFGGYHALHRHLLPEPGKKPPTHEIVNGSINFVRITHVSCKDVGAPKWEGGNGGYWTGEITLTEYAPPQPTNTGLAGKPGKPDANDPNGGRPDPNARLKLQRDALLAEYERP